ncbi:MAG: type II secretion system F family protein [Gammaproteobacteria bacterium]|nr:type II secretion system F family protein [Gammaproteobacteria bacterium]
MAHFKYKALDAAGKTVEGSIEQPSADLAAHALASEGLMVLSLEESRAKKGAGKKGAAGKARKKRGNSRDRLLHFTRELSVMLTSGLPLDRSLAILAGMGDDASVQLVNQLRDDLRKGQSFAEALEQHPEFSSFYVNMIRAGEASGTLEGTLVRMTEYLERAKALRKMIVSALTYPVILFTVAILSLVFLLAYVVPSFADLFADMGGSLPGPTRLVMQMGDFMGSWWWLVLGGLAGVYWLGKRRFADEGFRQKFDERVLGWPLVGELIGNIEMTRFARTLGVLLHGGVPMVAGLGIAQATVSNRTLRGELDTAVTALREGRSLSASLLEGGKFPELALHMLQVGEETGRLEEMLLKVAELYEDEVGTVTQRLLALLEPALILGLGVLIAGIIVSILLGILGVNELIG